MSVISNGLPPAPAPVAPATPCLPCRLLWQAVFGPPAMPPGRVAATPIAPTPPARVSPIVTVSAPAAGGAGLPRTSVLATNLIHALSHSTLPLVGKASVVIGKTGEKQEVEIRKLRLDPLGMEVAYAACLPKTPTQSPRLLGEIEIELDSDRISINMIESLAQTEYKGVGTALMQVAAEIHLKRGHLIPIELDAVAAEEFYEKMGFCVTEAKPHYKVMQLSADGLERWRKIIAASPILFP